MEKRSTKLKLFLDIEEEWVAALSWSDGKGIPQLKILENQKEIWGTHSP